jgi:CRISPR-associated protein Csx10
MSWFVEKEEIDNNLAIIYDFSIRDEHSLEKPKPPSGNFCDVIPESEELDAEEKEPFDIEPEKRGGAVLYSPARHLNVHIALKDANYRGEQNNVYRYEALAEGEVLAGAVISDDVADLDLLRSLLTQGTVQIGRSRTAGYGRVKIEDARIENDWREYAMGDDPKDGQVVVTLLSDAILRGKSGQVDGDLNAALVSALNLPKLRPFRAFRSLGFAGGFNRKWSLPLVQSRVLKAGSVYVYRSEDIDSTSLWALTERGIGERRSEGFGRFAVNWHTWPALERTRVEELLQSPDPFCENSRALARQMAQRRLRLLLDRRLAETVNKTDLSLHQPRNAQLSRVRNAAQESLVKGSLTPLVEFLAGLKSVRDQFLKARVGRNNLLDWIKERVERQDLETELLGSNPFPGVAGERAELTVDLRVEYTTRLIDGVMKKAIRQNQERERNQRRRSPA